MDTPDPFLEMLREEASKLERELANVELKQKRLILIYQAIGTYGVSSIPKEVRFAYTGTTAAVSKFLSESPDLYFTAHEIADGLALGGHRSVSPNFVTIILTICRRKGFIQRDRSGKKEFSMGLKNV